MEECIIFKSSNIKREKTPEGYNTVIANAYYILLNYQNDELYHKYIKIIVGAIGDVGVISYKKQDNENESIDTIYSKEEMKMKWNSSKAN